MLKIIRKVNNNLLCRDRGLLMTKIARKKNIRWGIICTCSIVAAACICIALLAASLFKQNADITAENDPGVAPVEAIAYTPIPITDRVVLKGSNIIPDQIVSAATIIPQPGEVDITDSLSDALKDPVNIDALFYSAVSVYYDLGQDFKYEGKTLKEWSADPALKKHDEVYQTWNDEVYVPRDAEMRAAEERSEKYAQGWEKHDPFELFNNYWNETQPEDVKAAYTKARENDTKAKAAYNSWIVSAEYRRLENDVFENERFRLADLGYNLSISDKKLIGNLTKQQIEDFPALSEYGYTIGWEDKSEILAG